MPRRTVPLATGEYYHVYNRGVARQPIFLTKRDYERFLLTVSYYRFQKHSTKLSLFLQLAKEDRARSMRAVAQAAGKLVELVSFVLMPNHFHFLVRQTMEDGISVFFGRAANSYTRYFNARHARVGPLFQGAFKAVRLETDEQLLHLSRYIHLNPLVAYVVKESAFMTYPWSSFSDFRHGKSTLLELDPVLGHFASPKGYEQFVLDRADYAKKLWAIQHLVLEH